MLPRPKLAPSATSHPKKEQKTTDSPLLARKAEFRLNFSKGVGIKHVVAMSEQLLTLIEAGLPLDRALHISLGSLSNERFKRVMEMVVIEVEKGSTLADAFAKTPSVFPRLYVNMIRAGEEGGVLPLVMRRLVEFYSRSIEFRSFLITSSIYPAVLFVFGVSALLGLTVFVLPKFGQIFADMNQTLPLPAAILISTGEFLQSNGIYIICTIALLILIFLQALRKPYWLEIWQRSVLRIPLVGNLILKIQLANVCRTWGTLMASGVPILTGMRIVRELSSNLPLTMALDRVVNAVQEGKGVATPILADPFFPRLLGQLATVGEESGALDKMLLKVADQYESDIQKATRNLVSIFEPVMILVMGGLIGTVVVSMLSAIFSINDMPL